jgi:hypothetical protein
MRILRVMPMEAGGRGFPNNKYFMGFDTFSTEDYDDLSSGNA